MTTRINVSIPDELKVKVDEYNQKNPYNKIVLSHVVQSALFEKLKEVSAY